MFCTNEDRSGTIALPTASRQMTGLLWRRDRPVRQQIFAANPSWQGGWCGSLYVSV